MKPKNALIVYRLFLVLVSGFLVFLAMSNDVARSINAHYFPDKPNPVESWHTWAFIVLAILGVAEAIFAIVWKRVRGSK